MKEVPLEAVTPELPSAEELEELERQFYTNNGRPPAQNAGKSSDLEKQDDNK